MDGRPDYEAEFARLVAIIARLRGEGGCPWDRAQDHRSLRENLLEECYEVLEALDNGDGRQLCEELGDLMLQIVLHAQIAREAGEFELAEVLHHINAKLVYRHPHIFGSLEVADADEVTHNWEELKRRRRADGVSMLAGVPREMPALAYSHRVQSRVARVGFDWKDSGDIVAKLAEEVAEFKAAVTPEERAREFGDLLFTLVNIARREGIDPEAALRETNQRFYRRFSGMEKLCRERGLKLNELSIAEQDKLWDEVKLQEKKDGRGERT